MKKISHLKNLIILSVMISASADLGATPRKTLRCHESETTILTERAAVAQQRIAAALANKDKVYATLVTTFRAPDSLKARSRFAELLTCIDRKFSQKRYELRCKRINNEQKGACIHLGHNYGGYVDGGSIIRSHVMGNGHVNICENSIDSSDFTAGLITHEVAHLCLAQDLGYFRGLSDPTLQKSDWYNNADTYDNIVQYLDQLL